MKKIVVLDGHTLNPGDLDWKLIKHLGVLTVHDHTPPEKILERARDADILLTNKTPLDAKILAELPALKMISVLATGYNVVDVEAAKSRGVFVANVPEYGTQSVAQHTIAMLFALIHRVEAHDAQVRDGEWARRGEFSFWLNAPVELAGRSLGIVGFGRIGQAVAKIAQALGMRVFVARRRSRAALPVGVERLALGDIFSRSDVITLHCPLTAENERFVDQAMLAKMKPTSYLLNTARGGLIDEAALVEALEGERLAGAALDVVTQEPIPEGHPLLTAPRCLLTPHMAWSSVAARRRLMQATAKNIQAFLAGSPIHGVA